MRLNSLPTAASQSSHWLAHALREDDDRSPALQSRIRADVCIVGGGYTGLWTAIELKQRDPGISVAVVEAQLCGSGASGTNAGFLMNLWPKYPALVAHAGADEGARLARASAEAVEDVIAFAGAHAIDASIRRCGWLWTATAPDQDDAWMDTLDALADVPGAPLHEVSRERAAELAGSPARGGAFDPSAAVLQPAALARGLRRAAADLGVDVYEQSPVRAIEGTGPVRVRTDGGVVTADRVVLAINAWASSLPWVRRHLVMTASDNFVTEPLPPELRTAAGEGTGASDSRRLLNYWRTTDDGRLLFGKGGVGLGFRDRGASSMFGPVPHLALLGRHFERSFPQLSGLAISSWRAPVEYSLTSLPFFTALPDNPRVFVGTGYSGDGVGPSRLGGRILASLATGADDEWSDCGLTRLVLVENAATGCDLCFRRRVGTR
ncbi:glycine/D-amino acid oxidase-like deaminating enzyme [Amycolatopsis echigonensis]|uniref:Glycine/D-amino acid oxidase-like deaminating enzyme n=1 Tax=Amycolatopsis echigonensis TaxID=2576905 RepID=A0A2N3WNN4_9PSEU|nr:FAD-dependent oxidoreductase [Amycolatopsis niigatensis]PKV95479.1 glycine/D-amino acid oxidase-like deaminating enzyme [Amycolatopsis niigatensis]